MLKRIAIIAFAFIASTGAIAQKPSILPMPKELKVGTKIGRAHV